MDLEALRHANFSLLDDAVTDWSTLVTHLEELKKDADDTLRKAANKADWAGVNAQVSKEFIGKTAGEFADAHTQATTIHNILRDTLGELKGYHRQLTEAIARGEKQGMKVSGGKGAFTVTASEPADGNGQKATQGDVDALRTEIQGILDKATESDTSASTVLQAISDQSTLGFSDASYKDRDSADAAVKEADALAALAGKKPEDLSVEDFDRLNRGLKKYAEDPLFAERFATDLGPRKTLEFWAGLTDPARGNWDVGHKRLDQFDDLQRNLGLTLAHATQSDSGRMTEWKRGMIDLGDKPLYGNHGGPMGFQVMSNLMRTGDYDDQFLKDYGTKLMETDRKFTDNGKHGAWQRFGMSPYLNRTKSDGGWDPMTGFLEALGHSPDAATAFFAQPGGVKGTIDSPSEVNPDLKYLLERHWMSDPPLGGAAGKTVAGRDALGHALEAATTGYAFDAFNGKDPMVPGDGDRRTAATADVMEQVAYLFGNKDAPKLLHDQPELADSLGKMGAAYIDDIDYSLSGIGDHGKDPGDFPAKYNGRADFGNQGAINFLSVLGQNETSHGIVTAGQHLYTLSLLDSHPPTDTASYEHGKDALFMEAETRGILDHSRVQQAESDFKADSEDANKSLGRSAEWGKYVAGAAVGTGIAFLPLPGAQYAGVAVAPIAADLAGEALSTFIGQETDKAVDKAEKDYIEDAQLTSQQFYNKGADTLGESYDAYFKDYAKYGGKADSDDIPRQLRDTYLTTGSNEDDLRGLPPYKD
ncbi:conserved hypothetical protein [Streptomyces sp. e14]|uniref:DUF6571 family protein n=1 Tax=Streptomyces sp. e14 TaxID=645465 RepID=UPI0001D06525|nr:DUF6571 family protein [Streptomyces sp. e14]EFF93429.1 conserved hypothetical protein [Streptomyces sp. e14]